MEVEAGQRLYGIWGTDVESLAEPRRQAERLGSLRRGERRHDCRGAARRAIENRLDDPSALGDEQAPGAQGVRIAEHGPQTARRQVSRGGQARAPGW
jgi:hypothetical protein